MFSVLANQISCFGMFITVVLNRNFLNTMFLMLPDPSRPELCRCIRPRINELNQTVYLTENGTYSEVILDLSKASVAIVMGTFYIVP